MALNFKIFHHNVCLEEQIEVAIIVPFLCCLERKKKVSIFSRTVFLSFFKYTIAPASSCTDTFDLVDGFPHYNSAGSLLCSRSQGQCRRVQLHGQPGGRCIAFSMSILSNKHFDTHVITKTYTVCCCIYMTVYAINMAQNHCGCCFPLCKIHIVMLFVKLVQTSLSSIFLECKCMLI